MKNRLTRTLVSLSVLTLTLGVTAPALATSDTGLRPMLINAPVLISAGAGWQDHWAQADLVALRSSVNLKPDGLVSGATDPNEPLPLGLVAEAIVAMYGAGVGQGDGLNQAISLGLVRRSDFPEGQFSAEQTVPREQFALLLTRALGINGAEDSVPAIMIPNFVDASAIQTQYRAAVALMQAEGLMIGDGEGRFSPAQPITYAQAVRTMVKVSGWVQQRVARLSGLNPAEATYLIEQKPVTLTDGISKQPAAPGSASMTITRLTDRQASGDLEGDGRLDEAAVLVRTSDGTGTFYYLGAVLNDGTPVESVFLGDRIAVQNVRIVAGKVAVDLLTRGATDPMVTKPYVKETRYFEIQNGALVPSAS